jgi:RNA polymerase sigma-70 factor, ECF subfamily
MVLENTASLPKLEVTIASDGTDAGEVRRLLLEAQAGDQRAFGSLIRKYESRIISVAYRLVGNREDALDVAQDALLRLYRFLGRVDGERDFGGWLYRVVVNASMDLLERRQRHACAVRDMKEGLAAEDAMVMPSAENTIEGQRVGVAVNALLARLPIKERTALVLRDVEGLSTREVATVLGSSEGTVRSQICAARIKLRELREELERGKRPGVRHTVQE